MKLISVASITVVASLMALTPGVTAFPQRLAGEEMEVVNIDSLINELDSDVAMREEILGLGGRSNLITKLAGGGLKGALIDQAIHRLMKQVGEHIGVDLSGILDAVVASDEPDIEEALAIIRKNKKLSSLTKILSSFGGASAINASIDSLKGVLSGRKKLNLIENII